MPFRSMIASIGTGLVNNALSQSNASSQREWQERMWHMQNAYNHPAAMADRMRAAGLNPYMMQGAEPAGSVGTGATAQTIPLDNPLAYAKIFAEIDNLNASTNKVETETDKLLKDMAILDILKQKELISVDEYEFNMKNYYEAWKDKNPYTLEADNTEADTALKQAQTTTEGFKQTNLSADSELKSSQKLLTDIQKSTEELRQLNIKSDTTLKDNQAFTEELRAIAQGLDNHLTAVFGPTEHWADLGLMKAQYDKLVSEHGKIEADRFMLNANFQLELLKLEFQDIWVDKNINSQERIAILKNINDLTSTLSDMLPLGKNK